MKLKCVKMVCGVLIVLLFASNVSYAGTRYAYGDVLRFVLPEIVCPSEFDFGGYVLLIKTFYPEIFPEDEPEYVERNYDVFLGHQVYALFGDGIKCYSQGRAFYEELNYHYFKLFLPNDLSLLYGVHEDCIRAHYTRNVVFISADGNRVLCMSPRDIPEPLFSSGAPRVYEIFERGELMHSVTTSTWVFYWFFQVTSSLSSYIRPLSKP